MTDITVISLAPAPVTVLVLPPAPVSLVSAGQGLQGVPGPAGAAGAAVVAYPTAQAVSGHVAIVLDALGQCLPADCANATHHAVAGITTQAATLGQSVEVTSRGPLEHSGWVFTPGLPVFLGLAGALTQSLPGTAVFSKVLGVAVSPTRISVDFQPAIFTTN